MAIKYERKMKKKLEPQASTKGEGKLRQSVARNAGKFLNKDFTHVVLVCAHRKARQPIVIFRGDVVTLLRLTNMVSTELRKHLESLLNPNPSG